MSGQTITGWFILLTILTISGYDLWVWKKYGVASTISDVTREFGEQWPLLMPLLAFAMGCLYGHFFLQ
jgi:hypothetical protein